VGVVADAPPGAGARFTPTAEALAILGQLGTARVQLALLERTPICRAVAALRAHGAPAVAVAAEAVVGRWRALATEALAGAGAPL
jgi:hypothetical protein